MRPGSPKASQPLLRSGRRHRREDMAALEEAFGDVIQRQITDDASFDVEDVVGAESWPS